MPSGKKSKQARRVAAAAPPPVQSKGSPRRRQADPKVLAIGGGIAAIVVVVIVLAVALGGGGSSGIPKGTPTVGSSANGLPGSDEVATLYKGIPQDGVYLGKTTAPAQMVIYIDLQCPYCQQYETTVMPTIVKKYVRTGKLRIQVQPWAFLGTDSTRGQKAMFAAAKQDKAWNFAEVLYLNQGEENTGWLTDSMIAQIASSVDGLNVPKLFDDRDSGSIKSQISDVAAAAEENGVSGTPTVFVGKTGTKPKLVGSNGSVPDLQQTEDAIDAAVGA